MRNGAESSRSSARALMASTRAGLGLALSVRTVTTCRANASDSGGKCLSDSNNRACLDPSDRMRGVEMFLNAVFTESSQLG